MSDSPNEQIQEVASHQPTQQTEQHENNKSSLEHNQQQRKKKIKAKL